MKLFSHQALRRRDPGIRFNITPLIDICFNLIIFFVLASLYVRKEVAEKVVLPSAGQFDARDAVAPRRLVITMNEYRRMFVGGEEVQVHEAERLIGERCRGEPTNFEVRVRADKRVPYADVKPLILACARHGVTNLKFAVEGK